MPSSARSPIVLPSSTSRYFISPIQPYYHYNSTSPYPTKLSDRYYVPVPTPVKCESNTSIASSYEEDKRIFSYSPSSDTSVTDLSASSSSISTSKYDQKAQLDLVLYYNSRPVRNYMQKVMQPDRFDQMLLDGFPALCERHLTRRCNRSIPCRCGQRQMTLRISLTPIHCRATDAEIYGNRLPRIDSLPSQYHASSFASPRSSSSSTPLLSKRQRNVN